MLSCGSKDNIVEPSSEEPTEPSEEPVEPSEEPVGTDDDGDGITIEDGDCDDTSDQSFDGRRSR